MLGVLEGRYQEQPVAVGITSGGGLLEVLSSPSGSSWTIIITSPRGMACVVSTGHGWRVLEPEWPLPGGEL